MGDLKFVSEKVYKHRSDFFLQYGEKLVSDAIDEFSRFNYTIYNSAISKPKDFSDKNLFEFIEKSINKNIEKVYKINEDHGLIKQWNENDVFPFYPTGIPVKIRELLNEDFRILEEYYKECVYSYLKRFFIRGRVSIIYLKIDLVYKHGFNKFKNNISRYNEGQIEKELKNYTEDGLYGLLNNADLYTKYTTQLGEEFNVQLLKFNTQNYSTQPLIFNTLIFDIELNPIDYIKDKIYLDEYIESFNSPNNKVRDLLGLPRIGEGWISETKLYYQLKSHFNNHLLLQHQKPKWLGRQHFDIYFPYLNIAVEYQGKQHYEPIDFFGGINSFEKNLERDKRKRQLALDNNCDLIYVDEKYEILNIINSICLSKNYK